MYRQGYFRQRIDAGGWQHEYWVDTDPERLPAALVTGDDGHPLTVTVIGVPSSPVTSAAGRRSGSVSTQYSCYQPPASMRWRK